MRATSASGRRVQQLVTESADGGEVRDLHAAFVGVAVATVMAAIQRGEILAATGLADAGAYAELAELVLVGLVPPAPRPRTRQETR